MVRYITLSKTSAVSTPNTDEQIQYYDIISIGFYENAMQLAGQFTQASTVNFYLNLGCETDLIAETCVRRLNEV